MIYAVIDTNVLVSAALTYGKIQSVPYSVFRGIAERKYVPLVDDNIIREYREVLSRSKFSIDGETATGIVETIRMSAINEIVPPTGVELPDADDVIFYDVAKAHQDKGAYLVTGNLKHFPNCEFAVSPRGFLNIISPNMGMLVNENAAVYDSTGLLALLREAQRQAHENGVDNLTEEEIEAEIKAYRAERKKLGL